MKCKVHMNLLFNCPSLPSSMRTISIPYFLFLEADKKKSPLCRHGCTHTFHTFQVQILERCVFR